MKVYCKDCKNIVDNEICSKYEEDFVQGGYTQGYCAIKNDNGKCQDYERGNTVIIELNPKDDEHSLSWSEYFKRNVPGNAINIKISYELE